MAHERILQAADRLILQDGGTVDRPDWECDVVTAKWECKTELVQKLIPAWGEKHPQYGTLTKTSHRLREAKHGMTSLDCTYRGLVDGKVPKTRERNSLAMIEAQLVLALNLDGVAGLYEPSITVSVYVPQTQYDYFTTKKPKGPRFRGKINYVEGAFEIAARSGSQRQAQINIIISASLAQAMAGGKSGNDGSETHTYYRLRVGGQYNGVAHVVTSNYQDDQIAEGLWRVTETSSVKILPPDDFNGNFMKLSTASNSTAT